MQQSQHLTSVARTILFSTDIIEYSICYDRNATCFMHDLHHSLYMQIQFKFYIYIVTALIQYFDLYATGIPTTIM